MLSQDDKIAPNELYIKHLMETVEYARCLQRRKLQHSGTTDIFLFTGSQREMDHLF